MVAHDRQIATQARSRLALVTAARMPTERRDAQIAALESAGFDIVACNDQNTVPDADVLLVSESTGSLRRIARALERHPSPPPVISWAAEPLPPIQLAPWAERLGIALSPMTWGLTWGRPILMTLSRPVFLAIARFGLRGGHKVEARAIQVAIGNLAWIQRGLSRGWLTTVGVTTMERVQSLKARGIAATFLPAGIGPHYGEDRGQLRDIDVLFIGKVKQPLRRRRMEQVVNALRARGMRVEVITGGLHGDARTDLVNRCKVVLNINYFYWDTAWMRWCLATQNGAAVVSEPQSLPAPLRPGIDYLEAPNGTLADEIEALIADEPRRLAMVASCRARMYAEMSLDASARKIATLARQIAAP